MPYLRKDVPILFLSVQKNLKEYFYDDIFEFGYLINQKEKMLEYLEKVENFDKFIEKRTQKIEYYMGPSDANSTKRAICAFEDIVKKTKCKRTHGLATCYRWFDYFGTLCVGVETPTYKLISFLIIIAKKFFDL